MTVNRPRPYDLSDPAEVDRLHRETWGYLKTCHKKHGTDWEGRQFAIDALETLWRRCTKCGRPHTTEDCERDDCGLMAQGT